MILEVIDRGIRVICVDFRLLKLFPAKGTEQGRFGERVFLAAKGAELKYSDCITCVSLPYQADIAFHFNAARFYLALTVIDWPVIDRAKILNDGVGPLADQDMTGIL